MLETLETSSSVIPPFGHDALRPMLAEFVQRRQSGEAISVDAMLRAHQELMPELEQQLHALDRVARAAALPDCRSRNETC